tara:strand:- start:161 stop:457 length:297 start_codon:yes stop_codon:yes gene_type:complete
LSATDHPHHHLYNSAAWRRLRERQLSQSPLCVYCLEDEVITAATICDHIEPHRGNVDAFWRGPFQSLCKACHDGRKQREELGLSVKGATADGWPLARG